MNFIYIVGSICEKNNSFSAKMSALDPHYNNYLECASLSIQTCKTTCMRGCSYSSCQKTQNIYNSSNITILNTEIYGLCLPSKLSVNEYQQRCSIYNGI